MEMSIDLSHKQLCEVFWESTAKGLLLQHEFCMIDTINCQLLLLALLSY